nr:hypothetical protein [Marseillevirus cajuinensis]
MEHKELSQGEKDSDEVIYLVRNEAVWKKDVFKIGRSSNWRKRLGSYGTSTRVLKCVKVSNSYAAEKRLIDAFCENFGCVEGKEYFLCPERKALEIFDTALENFGCEEPHEEQTKIPKQPEIQKKEIPEKCPISAFFVELDTSSIKKDKEGFMISSEVYRKFCDWCISRRQLPMTHNMFGRKTKEHLEKKTLFINGKTTKVCRLTQQFPQKDSGLFEHL